MTRRIAILAATAGALAVAGAGCGGGSDTGSTEASVTKQQYKQSVVSRCQQYQQDRQAAAKPLRPLFASINSPSQADPQQLKAAADKIAALDETARGVITDLEALPRPPADAAKIEQAFKQLDAAKEAFDEADQAAADGDGAALQDAYNKVDQNLKSLGSLSETYGFSACN